MEYSVGGVSLGFAPVMIGAGVCKTPDRAGDWLKIAPVVAGSFTHNIRGGNTGKLHYPETYEEFKQKRFGLNNYGMPNSGFSLVSMEFVGKVYENALIISIAGFSPDEYVEGVKMFSTLSNVAALELNFGCPNTEHKEILSFDYHTLQQLLEKLSVLSNKKPLWLKFSPFSNPAELARTAKLVNEFKGIVKAVVTCNTFPNGYAGNEAINTNLGHYGGISGPVLKNFALGQVHEFRARLDPSIDVIGVGGIINGNDIVDFFDAGAQAVQLTSLPFWLGAPNTFWDLLTTGPDSANFVKEIQHS
jgi:dihydroorotate dehydrogenase (fumarate)